jgi:two-component system phosphate regulon sensor histidine kinase PhoR
MPNSSSSSIQAYIGLPYDSVNWIGLLLFTGILAWLVRRTWDLKPRMPWQKWILLVLLASSTFLAGRLLVVKPDVAYFLPLPGVPVETSGLAIFLLACLPFMLGSGFLGVTSAAILGGLSGASIALVQTHQLMTVVEYAALALVFAMALRQPYRARLYRILRHPLGAGLLISIGFTPNYIISAMFSTPGSLEARLDYALTQVWLVAIFRGCELLAASLVGEIIFLLKVPFWHRLTTFFPAPEEKSLRVRFFYGTVPLILVLFFALTAADWVVAGDAARRMIQDRLSNTTGVVADSVPSFIESGKGLLGSLATADLLSAPEASRAKDLQSRILLVPFFRELALFDRSKNLLASYPEKLNLASFSSLEDSALTLALDGVPSQYTVIPHAPGENSVQISFVASIGGETTNVPGVLLGRTDFNIIQFTNSALASLERIKELGGEGAIVDENGNIIYNTTPAQVDTEYAGRRPANTEFFDEVAPDGTRRLVYYQLTYNGWAVVASVPAGVAQSQALQIAYPLLIILIVITTALFIFWAANLRSVTVSLRELSQGAALISRGQLEHSLQVPGDDEVGQLGHAFEDMRQSLKARLDELNRLLKVSQGIASHLKIEDAMASVLDAALGDGAAAARVVLVRDVTLDLLRDRLVAIGKGPASANYAYLDEQIFELTRQQPLLSIPNTTRIHRLTVPPGCWQPGAVIALALPLENRFYGALWVAYDQPHNFSEAEVRFLGTLAGQAALAAANASLYASAEIGRQRLMAVLASTPEPVLVIDEKMRLLLLNPAAQQVPGLVRAAEIGHPVRDVVVNLELLEQIVQPLDDNLPGREITLANNRTYKASVSPVSAEGKVVGRVCLLQDITRFKELDTMKTEFVATVSHDLRSPLVMMRGQVTMFQMIGELNDQQKTFMKKIVKGLEDMSHLVNNLLSMGRMESQMGMQYERINAQELITQVLSDLQPQALQQNIQVENASLNLPPAYLEADRDLLKQAITNLVDNGIKYTPVGGKVKLSIQPRPDSVVFVCEDTGIGIAPLDLPHIFDKYYRGGRRDSNQQRGSGLGLSIVKSTAERHGGSVRVDSKLGKGSIFYMEIPLAPKK